MVTLTAESYTARVLDELNVLDEFEVFDEPDKDEELLAEYRALAANPIILQALIEKAKPIYDDLTGCIIGYIRIINDRVTGERIPVHTIHNAELRHFIRNDRREVSRRVKKSRKTT